MKRSVGIEYKLTLATAIVLFVLMALIEPRQALLLFICSAIVSVLLKLREKPPRWLLRSPLGRWLRR